MKRVVSALMAAILIALLCACGAGPAVVPEEPTPEAVEPTPTPTPLPTEPPKPKELDLPDPPEGWEESYASFVDDNYDIFAALWPEGLTGVGFIDLDLDGTPEMVVFDLGASATLGVQLFDLIDGQVYCVSSVLENAEGAFGGEHFSRISICASYFESFRLTKTDVGYSFWVSSSNGTLESSWDEIVRFDSEDGVLTPASVCGRYLESNAETGLIVKERYTVGGEETDEEGYASAASIYMDGADTGYEAKGVFLWNDMNRYDTTYDGLMAMVRDAASAYVPVDVN